MGRKASAVDDKVRKAAEVKAGTPILTFPQAMMAAEFTSDEAWNTTIQMKVRRFFQKLPKAPPLPPDQVPIVVQGNDTPMSPLTKQQHTQWNVAVVVLSKFINIGIHE